MGPIDAVCSGVVRGSFLRTNQSCHPRSRTPSQKVSTASHPTALTGVRTRQPPAQPLSFCHCWRDARLIRGRAEGSRYGHSLALSATEGAGCPQHLLSGAAPSPPLPAGTWSTRVHWGTSHQCVCVFICSTGYVCMRVCVGVHFLSGFPSVLWVTRLLALDTALSRINVSAS